MAATRRLLLDALMSGSAAVNELAAPFASARPASSQHLRVLREAGLVREHRQVRKRIYELNPAPLDEVRDWPSAYDSFWADRMRALGDFLEDRQGPS